MTERRAKIKPGELPDEPLADRQFTLPERIAHYFRDVLRLEPGDAVELFDGQGRLLEGRIQSARDSRVRMAVFEDRKTEANESPCRVTLCASLPKRKRWRWILEKTTELGVARIVPLETSHGVVEIPDDRLDDKLDRWRRILGEAARQCERTQTPELVAPCSIDDALERESDGQDLLLHARRGAPSLGQQLDELAADGRQQTRLRLWVGPEGGFADREADRLLEAGARLCRLGPRVLRAETAAVVATTLAQDRLGDIGPRDPDSPDTGERPS